jgi:hypothetical protein
VGESSSKKKSKSLMLIVIAIVAAVITSVIVYRLYVGTPATSQLSDPLNDVELSIGTQYPGMIDVVSAALDVNGTTFNVNINLRVPFHDLGDGEIAQWNVTVILENETDVLKTYEIGVNMNSTQLTGSIEDVETQNVQNCQVLRQTNSLTVLAVLDGLSNAKTIEWRILTSYEQYSGGELTTSASDLAPDEGLQKTVLRP